MEIYYFTILLFSFLSLFEWLNKDKNIEKPLRIIHCLVFVVLVVEIGLRWETGTDWSAYLDHFMSFARPKEDGFTFEWGYDNFVRIIYSLTGSYSFFLFCHAIVFYIFIFKSFKYFTPYFLFAILFMYAGMMGLVGSNRQLLALGLGMISLKYLVEKKYYHYLGLVLLAVLFHTTAFLYLIFFFLKKKFRIEYILIFIFICLIVGSTQIPFQIFSLGGVINDFAADKTEIYFQEAKNGGVVEVSLIGLIKRIAFLLLFLRTRNYIEKYNSNYNLLLNGYIIGFGFYFLFYLTLPVMISRGSLYFNSLEPILLSLQLYLIKDSVKRTYITAIIFIFSIFLLHQSISAYPEIFDPYKGIFINSDFTRKSL